LILKFFPDGCQRLPPRVDRRIAIAFLSIQIHPALRADSLTLFIAQNPGGEAQLELFDHHLIQVDLVIIVDGKVEITFLKLDLATAAPAGLSRRVEQVEGEVDWDLDILQASITLATDERTQGATQSHVDPNTFDPAGDDREIDQSEIPVSRIQLTANVAVLEL
jgi:uncharacterized Zn finger protein